MGSRQEEDEACQVQQAEVGGRPRSDSPQAPKHLFPASSAGPRGAPMDAEPQPRYGFMIHACLVVPVCNPPLGIRLHSRSSRAHVHRLLDSRG